MAGTLAVPAAAQDSQTSGDDEEGGKEAAPTFQEVMQNPGDLELSFRYAREQIRQGNLTRASATLDRILLMEPSLQDVRLMYGIVLYRLGDLSSAESELERVDGDALPGNLQAELQRYRERIAEAQRKTTVNASFSTGFAHETNPTGAPEGGDAQLNVGGQDVVLDIQEGDDDFSWLFDARGEVRHELDTQLPVTLFGQGFASIGEQFDANSQDLAYGALRTGADVRTLWVDVTPSLTVGGLTLSDQTFYRFAGPGLRVERPLNGRVTAFVDTTWYAESFEGIDESTTAEDRSGHRFQLRTGLQGTVTPTIRAGLSVGATRKTARADFEEFTRADVKAVATAVIFDNHFVQGALTVGHRDYDDNDPFISANTARRDTFARVRLSYGLPLRFTEDLPEELEGVRLVPSVEYYYQDSNIPNFDYDNLTTSLVISKDFTF